jgi:pimeloyl-ACP methyl ester carboxylesterase
MSGTARDFMSHILSRRGVLSGVAASAAAAALGGCATAGATRADRVHFVLVHGAWHGAWCWNKVVPLLREQGHLVTAVDLPGRWQAPARMADIRAADYAETVGQVLRSSPLPVVLVGHSLGGATISLAAEQHPERIRRLVYLTAFLVPPGQAAGRLAMSDRPRRSGATPQPASRPSTPPSRAKCSSRTAATTTSAWRSNCCRRSRPLSAARPWR